MSRATCGRAKLRRTSLLGLILFSSGALALRLWGLERNGLWIDEILTGRCLAFPLSAFLDCPYATRQSPLYFFVTDLLYTVLARPPLPAPEWLVRLPEVIAGTASIGAAWLAARELLGTRGAWLTAFWMVFATTAVVYSQEARPYAWLILFANLSTWALVRALRRSSLVWGASYGALAALVFYSQYLGTFLIAAQLGLAALHLLVSARARAPDLRRQLAAIALGVGLMLVAISPWLGNTLAQIVSLGRSSSYTPIPLTPAYWADAQTWLVLNAVGQPHWALVLLALEMVGALWLVRHAREAAALVGCWLALPLVFLVVRGGGFAAFRYWIVVLPPVLWLLSAAGLAVTSTLETFWRRRGGRFPDPRAAPALVALAGALLLLPSLVQSYVDPFESWRFDDWRGVAQTLRAHAAPGDLVLAVGPDATYHRLALEYYAADLSLTIVEPEVIDAALLATLREGRGRAWAILYTRAADGGELPSPSGPDVETYRFRNLALVAPRATGASETRGESFARLLPLLDGLDDRIPPLRALLEDRGGGQNRLVNPAFMPRKNGLPRGWQFSDGRGVAVLPGDPPVLQLAGRAGQDLLAQQSLPLEPGAVYLLRFECRSSIEDGAQRSYVTFERVKDDALTFPSGAGAVCPPDRMWHANGFAFRAPPASESDGTARVLLRAQGPGTAEWRRLALIQPGEK